MKYNLCKESSKIVFYDAVIGIFSGQNLIDSYAGTCLGLEKQSNDLDLITLSGQSESITII